jgi:DeoR/GlpR family transcriptional regulator of sugar metabolism
MKKDMMKCSKRNFLLMDTVKVGQTSLHKLAPVKDFSDVILNADVDRELSDEINEHTLVHFAR